MQDILQAVGGIADSITSGMEYIGQDMASDSKEAFEGIQRKVRELSADADGRSQGHD